MPEAARKPYEVMMEARAKAFELAVPGNVMHDVDEAVNNIMKKSGYEDNLLLNLRLRQPTVKTPRREIDHQTTVVC